MTIIICLLLLTVILTLWLFDQSDRKNKSLNADNERLRGLVSNMHKTKRSAGHQADALPSPHPSAGQKDGASLASAEDSHSSEAPVQPNLLTYDEILELVEYGGVPVRFPSWSWGTEYEELSDLCRDDKSDKVYLGHHVVSGTGYHLFLQNIRDRQYIVAHRWWENRQWLSRKVLATLDIMKQEEGDYIPNEVIQGGWDCAQKRGLLNGEKKKSVQPFTLSANRHWLNTWLNPQDDKYYTLFYNMETKRLEVQLPSGSIVTNSIEHVSKYLSDYEGNSWTRAFAEAYRFAVKAGFYKSPAAVTWGDVKGAIAKDVTKPAVSQEAKSPTSDELSTTYLGPYRGEAHVFYDREVEKIVAEYCNGESCYRYCADIPASEDDKKHNPVYMWGYERAVKQGLYTPPKQYLGEYKGIKLSYDPKEEEIVAVYSDLHDRIRTKKCANIPTDERIKKFNPHYLWAYEQAVERGLYKPQQVDKALAKKTYLGRYGDWGVHYEHTNTYSRISIQKPGKMPICSNTVDNIIAGKETEEHRPVMAWGLEVALFRKLLPIKGDVQAHSVAEKMLKDPKGYIFLGSCFGEPIYCRWLYGPHSEAGIQRSTAFWCRASKIDTLNDDNQYHVSLQRGLAQAREMGLIPQAAET